MDKARESEPGGARVAEQPGLFTIPTGTYALSSAMDDKIRMASGAAERGPDGRAHPAFAFIVALGGMGVNIATLCGYLNLPFTSGAMLGRCGITYDRPLLVDHLYAVSGEVVSIVRKASTRFGAADHVRLALSVDADMVHFASVDIVMIVPIAKEMS